MGIWYVFGRVARYGKGAGITERVVGGGLAKESTVREFM